MSTEPPSYAEVMRRLNDFPQPTAPSGGSGSELCGGGVLGCSALWW